MARNDLAKLKLNVARIIGLPPGQEFVLTEKAPYQALAALPLEAYLQRAYAERADYQAALAQVRAAELSRRSRAPDIIPRSTWMRIWATSASRPASRTAPGR